MLNGIDISKYQEGIDLNKVPADFVIIQHSFGCWTSPTFENQIQDALSAGKLIGIYHYVTGSNGEGEYFVNGIKKWAGQAVIALDFESGSNNQWGNWNYLKNLIKTIQSGLHVNPLLYGPASSYADFLKIGSETNCGLWMAEYADMEATGYQKAPWNEGAYQMAMFQYSSTGSLFGYAGALDLDLFYGDRQAWEAYAKTTEPIQTPKPVVSIQKTIPSFSAQTLSDNQTTLPTTDKIAISPQANPSLFLAPASGSLALNKEPYFWQVQINSDHSISLASQDGKWITLSQLENGSKPYLAIGNGSISQRWMAENLHDGFFKLFSCGDSNLALDLPSDRAFAGASLQVWSQWSCENQRWCFMTASTLSFLQTASKLGNKGYFQKDKLALQSLGGVLSCSFAPSLFTIQKNEDNTLSFADGWGNWLTYRSNPEADQNIEILKGNGSSSQKWIVTGSLRTGFLISPLEKHSLFIALNKGKVELESIGTGFKIIGRVPYPTDIKPIPHVEKPADPAKKEERNPMDSTVKSADKSIQTTDKSIQTAENQDTVEKKALCDLKDLASISKAQQAEIGTEMAGVVKSLFHVKPSSNKFRQVVFTIGTLLAVTASVLLILVGCGILPNVAGVIAGVVSGAFSAFAHALGINISLKD